MSESLHPCLDCVLPDCDDLHRDCRLREALSKVQSLRRSGRKSEISEKQKTQFHIAYKQLYSESRTGRHLRDIVAEVGG